MFHWQPWFIGEKKRCNLSWFIVLRKKKKNTHIFLTCWMGFYFRNLFAITTREALTRSVSAISQNAKLKTGERQMSASNPMHSSGNSPPPCVYCLGLFPPGDFNNGTMWKFSPGIFWWVLVRIGSAFMWGFFFADAIRILIFATKKKLTRPTFCWFLREWHREGWTP